MARPGIRGVWLLLPLTLIALGGTAALAPADPPSEEQKLQSSSPSTPPDSTVPDFALLAGSIDISTNVDLTMPEPVPLQLPVTTTATDLMLAGTALDPLSVSKMSKRELNEHLKRRLAVGRYLRKIRRPTEAEPVLVEVLNADAPDNLKRSAMLEIAAAAQDQNDLSRSVQVYAQFLTQWSDDIRNPEVLFRQGQLFRQMGLNNLALSKFYSVMTSALGLKNERLDYYEALVLRAQTEIAETHFQLGKHAEAAEFYNRLLKQGNPSLNNTQILFRLVRSTAVLERHHDTVAHAQDFLSRYPEAPEQPEVRFHLALAFKEIGDNSESLEQVLKLLQEQRERTKDQPAVWAYWQQRTGNLIANQLYREGDYPRALGIYLDLVQLDNSQEWQLPVKYQIGVTYEQLLQPEKATEMYTDILSFEKTWGTNAAPGLKAIFDMARYRTNFIRWQNRAEALNHEIRTDRPPTF